MSITSKPDISVVMPTYNRAHIIRHAINGILDQTFTNWELLIVDDGSTDNTTETVMRFVHNDKRIKYYKLPHTGYIGKVRNYGNKRAQGKLVVVQDSDDVSFPDRLDVFWSEWKNTKADVLYHAMYMLFRDGTTDNIMRKFRPAMPYDQEKLVHSQYIPGQVAYTKKAITKVPYDETMQCMDDWQILLELSLNNYKFHPIQRALYEYWYVPDSVTINAVNSGKRMADVKVLMELLRKKYNLDIVQAEQENIDWETGKILSNETAK